MKYLLFLSLFLLGCNDSNEPAKKSNAEIAEEKRIEEIAQSYIGKCMVDWDGSLVMLESGDKMNNNPRTGLSLCYLNQYCDYKDESRCVTAKICSRWVSNDYFLGTVLKRVKPPGKCP